MPKSIKYLYHATLEHLHTLEETKSVSIKEIHRFINSTLPQYYIDFKETDFPTERTLTRKIKAIQVNDYIIIKVKQTLIRVYKNANNKIEETTLQEI